MKRISKQAKQIADRHIEARQKGVFDPCTCTTKEEVIAEMLAGKTCQEVIVEVEARYCSVTSSVLNGVFNHSSQNYRAGVYRGFKILLP